MQHLLTLILYHCLFIIRSQLVYIYCRMSSVQNVVAAECRRCRMWWVGVNWWVYDESVKINDHYASMMSRWWISDESVMNWWWISDSWVMIWWKSMMNQWKSMMRRWWIGNESGAEFVKINDESVISRWKLMMRRWVGAEMVMSRCLFRNSRISRY